MLPGWGRYFHTIRPSRLVGTRTAWTTTSDGEFFCPGCGGDRNYRRRTGRRRFTVLGVPLLPRGIAGPVVECGGCGERHGTGVLDHPTTHRFAGMLRDAVHTVALAVLAADGIPDRAPLETAAATVRAAGYDDCTEARLAALVEAVAADTGRLLPEQCGQGRVGLAIELHEALDPLAPHLSAAGRESVLVQAARIALADGTYTPAEREVLSTVGSALGLSPETVVQLLDSVRTTPS
ncbi:TerB family tellurite resistance protein [Streptomyces sp. NPDC058045]|uniref:TerB family tellurite resistance protein n=1 Tax=Streptomyces sp. NPDC058045 TaxID=3346311 RepID=UPI0036E15EFA